MSRHSKGAFSRLDGEFDYYGAESTLPDWLSRFAKEQSVKEAVQPLSAVEQARSRNPSIYDQMRGIVSNNGPKFSSVDEVVADYRKRTGMDGKAPKTSIANIAAKIVTASTESPAVEEFLKKLGPKIPSLGPSSEDEMPDEEKAKITEDEYLGMSLLCLDQANESGGMPASKIIDILNSRIDEAEDGRDMFSDQKPDQMPEETEFSVGDGFDSDGADDLKKKV